AKFDTQAARGGVIIAQGGSANGYSLFLAEGKLTFLVRSAKGVASVTAPEAITGAHTAKARLDASGTLALTLDDKFVGNARAQGLIAAMPVDGLNVGSDEG